MKQLNEFEKQMLLYRIDNLKNLSNKDFMVSFAGIVNDFDLLQKEDLENLQDHDWCRDNIRHEYTIVKPLSKNVSNTLVEEKKDNTGRQRYYDNVFYIKGKNVLLSSEWYDGTGRKPNNKTIFINWLRSFVKNTNNGNLQVSHNEVQLDNAYRPYITALRTKPFMLLAGISGTGKSRIVRKLAQATTTQKYDKDEDRWKDNRPENFELIQVKPNWHNSMDVVGFYSNISGKYEFTPFVEFIVKAWQHKDTPYFLCLDEMNLAPVEEYFAEFLSAIESRSTDEKGDYITDPIIKPFKNFGEKEGKSMLIQLLGDADPIDKNPIAIHFYEKGLTLPPNLMVMGTVNMDETTFSFSRKVLDRAMSMEMNEVDYDKFLSGESEQFPLLKDINDLLVKRPQLASEVKEEIDSAKVIGYLKDVNNLLDGTPFKLGYRAANEAMLYVAASRDFAGEKFSIEKALDEFTLMKILSRIEGDDNRLTVDENDLVLETIGKDSITDAGEDRINLLNCLRAIVRENIGSNTETEKKINIMYRTLEREHFVSYWA